MQPASMMPETPGSQLPGGALPGSPGLTFLKVGGPLPPPSPQRIETHLALLLKGHVLKQHAAKRDKEYVVNIPHVVGVLRQRAVGAIIHGKFGQLGARIVRILLDKKLVEDKQVAGAQGHWRTGRSPPPGKDRPVSEGIRLHVYLHCPPSIFSGSKLIWYVLLNMSSKIF